MSSSPEAKLPVLVHSNSYGEVPPVTSKSIAPAPSSAASVTSATSDSASGSRMVSVTSSAAQPLPSVAFSTYSPGARSANAPVALVSATAPESTYSMGKTPVKGTASTRPSPAPKQLTSSDTTSMVNVPPSSKSKLTSASQATPCCTTAVYAPAGRPSNTAPDCTSPFKRTTMLSWNTTLSMPSSTTAVLSPAQTTSCNTSTVKTKSQYKQLPSSSVAKGLKLDAKASVQPNTSSSSHTPSPSASFTTTTPVPSVSPEHDSQFPSGKTQPVSMVAAASKLQANGSVQPAHVSYSQDPSSWVASSMKLHATGSMHPKHDTNSQDPSSLVASML